MYPQVRAISSPTNTIEFHFLYQPTKVAFIDPVSSLQ